MMSLRRVVAAFAAWVAILVPLAAQGQPAPPTGRWAGTYTCGQGLTGITLVIVERAQSRLSGLFHFYADPSNPGVPTGCFTMSGTIDHATGRLQLGGDRWIVQPPGYVVVDFNGRIDASGGSIDGAVAGPACTTFALTRSTTPWAAPDACRAAIGKS